MTRRKWKWEDEFKDQSIQEIIKKLSEKQDYYTPIKAAYVLGKLRSKEAAPSLIANLSYQENECAYESMDGIVIAWALGRVKDKSAVTPLIELLQCPAYEVRAISAWALGQIGDKSAIPALIKSLETDEYEDLWNSGTSILYGVDEEDEPLVITTIIPKIENACIINSRGSSIELALKKLGYEDI